MFKKFLLGLLLALSVSCLRAQTVAYVTNNSSNTVSVIDTATNIVTATIPVGSFPASVVVSPDGTRAYVGNLTETVSVIDTASNAVVATVGGGGSGAIAISPDGKSLYVSNPTSVLVVSTATNSVVATIAVANPPLAAAITPDGAHLYLLSFVEEAPPASLVEAGSGGFFGVVSVIDTATNTVVVPSIPVNSGAGFPQPMLAVTPDGGHVYVASDSGVQVIATASNTVVATIPFPDSFALAITPDGSRVYATEILANAVGVIDTATNTVDPSTISVGGAPRGVAVTADGAFVYVVNRLDNSVSVIATATNTVVATVPVGNVPVNVALTNLPAPMATLNIENLVINSNLHEQGDFILGANSDGIDLAHQPLTITVNNFSLTIPAGSFKQVGGNMHFVFNGTVNGLAVDFNLQAEHGSSTQFDFVFNVHGVSISGPNPANVSLAIGNNSGSTTAPF